MLLMRASNFQTGGYSEAKYQELVGERQAYLLMGSGPVATPKFVDKRPTEEIDSIKVEIYLEGLGADRIKLPANFKLNSSIKDMQPVELINPQACEVGNNVYFKADDIKAVK